MPTASPKSHEHIGETAEFADHDRDLIQDLGRRLDSLWRCDQYIANAEGHDEVMAYWRSVKKQERQNIEQLRRLIKIEINQECF